jgi:hypothetical protein
MFTDGFFENKSSCVPSLVLIFRKNLNSAVVRCFTGLPKPTTGAEAP